MKPQAADARLLILAVVASLLWLCARSITNPAAPHEQPVLAASVGLEPTVLAVAEHGPQVLLRPSAQSALERAAPHGGLFCLLAAWSRLSVGRVGLLDPVSATRLPWLVVYCLGAAGIACVARRSAGGRNVALALLAWVASPWTWAPTIEGSLAAASLAVALLAAHQLPPGWFRSLSGVLLLALSFSAGRAGLWSLSWLVLWPAVADGARARPGSWPVSSLLAPAHLAIAVGLTLLWNPTLWRGLPVSGLRVALAAPTPGTTPGALGIAWWVLAALGVVACCWTWLAAIFATGKKKPGVCVTNASRAVLALACWAVGLCLVIDQAQAWVLVPGALAVGLGLARPRERTRAQSAR